MELANILSKKVWMNLVLEITRVDLVQKMMMRQQKYSVRRRTMTMMIETEQSIENEISSQIENKRVIKSYIMNQRKIKLNVTFKRNLFLFITIIYYYV